MRREIYPRHKAKCPSKSRTKFDGCRVYARYTITDPHSGKLLEAFNGALPPNITTKHAADTYVNQRFALVIEKHQRGDKIETANHGATVKAAAEKYIADQKRLFPALPAFQSSDNVRRTQERLKIDPNKRDHEVITKIELLFGERLPKFCEDQKPPIRYIRNVEYEHLVAFLDNQPGRTVYQIVDGVKKKIQMPPSIITKQKNQEFVKRFFRWLFVDAKLIETNPAERLKPIKLQKEKAPNPRFKEKNPKHWTPEQINAVRQAIPKACEGTKQGEYVAALFDFSVYANARITAAIQIECANLYETENPNGDREYAIVFYEGKVNGWVDCWLPKSCYQRLKNLKPKSEKYIFWSGNGDPETCSKDYSKDLLDSFRLAGIPERHEGGPRTHQFRHTNSSGVMDIEGGKLEHAAAALGHQGSDVWSARVNSGTGCPCCAGRKAVLSNCLSTTHPALAAQWHPTLNDRTPTDVTHGGIYKAGWQCPVVDDHVWSATVYHRAIQGNDCPYCGWSIERDTPRTLYFMYVADRLHREEYLNVGKTVHTPARRYSDSEYRTLDLRLFFIIEGRNEDISRLETELLTKFRSFRYHPQTGAAGMVTESFQLKAQYKIWEYCVEFGREHNLKMIDVPEFAIDCEAREPFKVAKMGGGTGRTAAA